ncbi:SHOCT domain-containing protein [Streptomyces sp. NPDC093225]|uniref:SHOCT domain-containing protein n=1 Tax=Streptomyces sp. NPDC093225 TaxID=3366034 RepID=UPI003826FDB5
MYGNGHDMDGWGWFATSLTTLLLLALVVMVAVYVLRPLTGDGARPRDPAAPEPERDAAPDAEQLLAQRFARGEIDDGEYARRLEVLRAHPTRRVPL